MRYLNYILPLLIIVTIFNCKSIIIDDTQPSDFQLEAKFIKIPSGVYTSGRTNKTRYIKYDYEMMKYPVTNSQYIEFLKDAKDAGILTITSQNVTGYYDGDMHWPPGVYQFVDFGDPDCRIGFNPPGDYVIKFNYFGDQKEGYDNHPVTEVTWFGANAFAEFYGLLLPSSEEWEKAVRANTSNIFAWGNIFDSTKVNYLNSGDKYDNGTSPVGFYNGENNTTNSYSPYGIYDMSGNVWQWTSGWKEQSPGKVLRGGSWQSASPISSGKYITYSELYSWFKPSYGFSPINSKSDIGFRCVRK